jgi:hypothetical protein
VDKAISSLMMISLLDNLFFICTVFINGLKWVLGEGVKYCDWIFVWVEKSRELNHYIVRLIISKILLEC